LKIGSYSDSSLLHLHGQEWVEKQRIAGKTHAKIMGLIPSLFKEDLSLLDYDKIIEDEILKDKSIPTFKGYKGFPNASCISVNKTLAHGIPSDYKLKDGDVVSFDFGVTFEGAIADGAETFIFGNGKNERMISATREALYEGIKSISLSKRIGSIGNAISKTAQKRGFNVITSYGGHSLDWDKPHAFVFVSNKSRPEEGMIFQPGMTLAIEPLFVPYNCQAKTKIMEDGWSVVTEQVSSHFEHTIFLHEDRIEIMTHRENEDIPREIPYS